MNLPELISLSDYVAPTMPTEHALRVAWNRLKKRISGAEDPLLQESGLQRGTLTAINDFADPPACGPLIQACDEQLGAWSRDIGAHPWLRTIIIPPCDTNDLLADWARTRGHHLLPDPDRIDLVNLAFETNPPDLTGDGLLVIPRLERWFLRQRNGLHAVRSLLALLANSERQCLVGCDSWAWRFIVKSAGADLALPRPQIFEPFDARRLRDWFNTLARDSEGVHATFRLAGNGDDVLACNDDDGEPLNPYLRQLASRSGGIPWVAWNLWRAGLKVSGGQEPLSDRATSATAGDARTVWVVSVDDPALPQSHEDRSLLVLQALLIHGALTPAEIDTVLPTTGEPDMLAALVDSGHLRREHASGRHSVRPSAYPAVRKALEAAGFPIGAV